MLIRRQVNFGAIQDLVVKKKIQSSLLWIKLWLFDFYVNGQRICSFLSCFHEDVLYFYDAFICDKQS
jgi:hypothetical protein